MNQKRKKNSTDPRKLGGSIVDPTDDPYGHDSVVVDTSNAVLVDYSNVCIVHSPSTGEDAFGLELSGRINQTSEYAHVLFLLGTDGAAAIISELMGLFARAGIDKGGQLIDDLVRRLQDIPR